IPVTLIVRDDLIADFATPDSTRGIVPHNVHFTDLSTGNPTSWEWDFDSNGTIDSTYYRQIQSEISFFIVQVKRNY
ncbi:hypothetical protein KAS41_04850, partial [Candidatus Parcubacteria bacterium]|nr:hypothetical protein [Candidatus Parcubacteria bacterium]